MLFDSIYTPANSAGPLPPVGTDGRLPVEWHTRDQARVFWRNVFKPPAPAPNVHETFEHRVRLYYRICRALGHQFNHLDRMERISSPQFVEVFDSPRFTVKRGYTRLLGIHGRIESIMTHTRICPAPPTDRFNGTSLSERRESWCEAMRLTAALLGVNNHRDPGLYHIVRPEWVCFEGLVPTLDHLIRYEEFLIEWSLENIPLLGMQEARQTLRQDYGLSLSEAVFILGQAKQLAAVLQGNDLEEQRAVMVLQLEDFVQRMRDTMQSGNEIKGLKQLAHVMGIGKAEPQDRFQDFIEVVKQEATPYVQLADAPARAPSFIPIHDGGGPGVDPSFDDDPDPDAGDPDVGDPDATED